MASIDAYLACKERTSRLISWVIRTSLSIPHPQALEASVRDGRLSVSKFLSLSKLIAEHIDPIPLDIIMLFYSVIQTRQDFHRRFKQIAAEHPDPDVERSNASHKKFIDVLSEAFQALGGARWGEKKSKLATSVYDKPSELEQLLSHANRFAILSVDEGPVFDEEDASTTNDGPAVEAPQNHSEQAKKTAAKAQSLNDLPMASFVHDENGLEIEYLMVVLTLVSDWIRLRNYLQGIWHDVAYNELNSAFAGVMSKIVINQVERSVAAIFIDHPGGGSYESVFRSQLSPLLRLKGLDEASSSEEQDIANNVKEQFLIHAHRNLVDFITDFRQNRTGRPTKRMRRQITKWDPNLDLQQVSGEERLNWRRSFTIKWLYDLVNVTSWVERKHSLQREERALEPVDLPSTSTDHETRRLFGLREFASTVTQLAMQHSGSDIGQSISIHHVFQLQCIVDSFTVSRGWSLSAFSGHVLETPPSPAYCPRRDVDLFLDRLHSTINIFQPIFEDRISHTNFSRLKDNYEALKVIQANLIQSPRSPETSPSSRFSAANCNGLWDYSPFLCGVNLAEGLVETYRHSTVLLGNFEEPAMLIHLHNMLVQKGYITEPVGLYNMLSKLFRNAFFPNGRIPTSSFAGSFRAKFPRHSWPVIKTKSYLVACAEAGWSLDCIPDDDIPVPSLLGYFRIAQTECTVDPATGQKRFKNTDLVRRFQNEGFFNEYPIKKFVELASSFKTFDFAESMCNLMVSKEFTMDSVSKAEKKQNHRTLSTQDLLHLMEQDVLDDIYGISGQNYALVTARSMTQFQQFEDELKRLQNPLYIQAYGNAGVPRTQHRVDLTYLALEQQDGECLCIMAQEFQKPRIEENHFLYWNDLQLLKLRQQSRRRSAIDRECSVM